MVNHYKYDGVTLVAWAHHKNFILLGGYLLGTVYQVDLSNGQENNSYSLLDSSSETCTRLILLPDDSYMAYSMSKGAIVINGTQEYTGKSNHYDQHHLQVNDMAWSPNGKWIASASDDKTVHVWDPLTQQTILVYRGHNDVVGSVSWSPDSTRIASTCKNDRQLKVWDVTTGQTIATFHVDVYDEGDFVCYLTSVSWSPDGKHIAIAAENSNGGPVGFILQAPH